MSSDDIGRIGVRTAPDAEDGGTADSPQDVVRLVVVDDSPDIRKTVSFLAEYAGAVVAGTYACVAQALRHESPVDLVLTDYHLPDGNGVILANALHERDPSLAVAIMSGVSPDDLSEALARAGVWAWLVKPVKLPQLRALVELVRIKVPVPGLLVGTALVEYVRHVCG